MSMKRFGNATFLIAKILVYARYRLFDFCALKVTVKSYLIKDILCNMCIH